MMGLRDLCTKSFPTSCHLLGDQYVAIEKEAIDIGRL